VSDRGAPFVMRAGCEGYRKMRESPMDGPEKELIFIVTDAEEGGLLAGALGSRSSRKQTAWTRCAP